MLSLSHAQVGILSFVALYTSVKAHYFLSGPSFNAMCGAHFLTSTPFQSWDKIQISGKIGLIYQETLKIFINRSVL